MKKLFFLLISVFFIFPNTAKAYIGNLVINEFSSSSEVDWVEIYLMPTATESANLSNYRIRDNTVSNKIDLVGELAPGSFKAFDFGNKLNNSGDNITLRLLDGENEAIVDQISYGDLGSLCTPSGNQSIGRKPDGNGAFVRLESATKEASNSSVEAICPTPTPSPTPTPAPTSTPTSTPAPTSSPTPNPTKKPTPKPTQAPTPTVKATRTPSPTPQVLGEATGTPEPKPSSTPPPLLSILMVIGGLAFVGISGVSLYKNYREQKLH